MDNRPIIGITMGDPVGIGPEITLKALCRPALYDRCRPLVLGDSEVLKAVNESLGTPLKIRPLQAPEQGLFAPGTVDVVSLSELDTARLRAGHPTVATGRAMVHYVMEAIAYAMNGRIGGLTTGPINKTAMHKAGFDFDGHTEILAKETRTSDYVMMLAGSRLRVALVTIHVPLVKVPGRLTTERIVKTIDVTEKALKESFGISHPRLAVAGLNPHAGEDGLFGDEERLVIEPALRQAVEAGLNVSGPHPPDTLFYWALKGSWDAVIAMYHDQGLIPFKVVHFTDGVNTTLGLPVVRTSVDHGTAYDIAGKGTADPGSMTAAIEMAALQARNRAKSRELNTQGRRAAAPLQR
jgi:4-hydroxythreonine-4-phosphate dehydrogenase